MKHGASLILLILFIVSIFYNVGIIKKPKTIVFNKYEMLFVTAVLFYWIVYFFQWAYFDLELSVLDNPTQILLILSVFMFIRTMPINPNVFYNSVLLGAFSCAVIAIYQNYYLNVPRSYGAGSIIAFGSLSMTLAMMCLTIAFYNRFSLKTIVFYLGAFLSIYASILSGSRGAWLILVSSLLMVILLNPLKWSFVSRIIGSVLIVILLFSAYQYKPIQTRVDKAEKELTGYFNEGKVNSSVGVRLELWRMAISISSDNILVGIGEGNFKEEIKKRVDKSETNPFLLNMAHVHQEYLSTLMNRGGFGLMSLLFIFLIPLLYFLKNMTSEKDNRKILSTLGLVLVTSVMTISLSDVYFLQHQNILFYFSFIFILFVLMNENRYRIESKGLNGVVK